MLVHEHILQGDLGHEYFAPAKNRSAADRLASALSILSSSGIETILDATTIGAGRDGQLLAEVAAKSGIEILCSTGIQARGFAAGAFGVLDAERLADVFTGELSEGIDGGPVRAAALVLDGVAESPELNRVLALAVAFAHAESGAPVLVRAPDCEAVARQVEFLIGRGVDPERILALDLDLPSTSWHGLAPIAHSGVFLGFTRIGHDDLPESARAAMIAAAAEGFGAERVCLSMSSWGRLLGPPDPSVETERGFGFLAPFLKRLGTFGVGEDQIDAALRAPEGLFA